MLVKKQLVFFSGVFALAGALLASCGGGGAAELNLEITFDSNGGSEVASQTVKYGQKASKPADPTKSGYTFDKWYADKYLKVEFDFNQEITADWTLYAGWNNGGAPAEDSSEEASKSEASQAEETSQEQPSSPWQMTFIDAGWWNTAAAGTTYTLTPADDGKGAFSTTLASYDTMRGYDEESQTNYWYVVIPADATKLQLFRTNGDGNADWGARTVVIDLTARNGKTCWQLQSTAAWFGDGNMAGGEWVA